MDGFRRILCINVLFTTHGYEVLELQIKIKEPCGNCFCAPAQCL
jgi:hypothetical protein